MGLIYRRRVNTDDAVDGSWVNVSGSGLSVSKRLGRFVTINTRGMLSVRLFKGLSFRKDLW